MKPTDLPPDEAALSLRGDVAHIVELAEPLEKLANEKGIFNVFDDGGYRTLLMLTMFDLKKPAGRLGDDAYDPSGGTYELKTINLINTKGETKKSFPGVTTEHTLRQENIDRYRKTKKWLIGVFIGNQPLDIWEIESSKLEPYYAKWEEAIEEAGNHEINNPKIPFAFIVKHGKQHPVAGTEHIKRPKPGKYRDPVTDEWITVDDAEVQAKSAPQLPLQGARKKVGPK